MSEEAKREHDAVLVVHDNDAFADIVATIVRDAGWAPVRVRRGVEANALTGSQRFRLAVVDVAVSEPFAFELVPALKASSGGIYVVLIASVYDKTAYKRRPKTLYGADDYLEQHHVPDKLPSILGALGARDTGALVEDEIQRKRQELRRAADETLGNGGRDPGVYQGLDASKDAKDGASESIWKARGLAKKLVMDISLYDEQAFLRGLESGRLAEELRPQLAEAKRFLSERVAVVGLSGAQAAEFIDDALASLLAADRGKKGGAP